MRNATWENKQLCVLGNLANQTETCGKEAWYYQAFQKIKTELAINLKTLSKGI